MVTTRDKDPINESKTAGQYSTNKTALSDDKKALSDDETALNNNERALEIIKRNSYWALGAGVIPVPALDFIAFIAVQVKMIKELADLYDIPFKESLAKSLVTSLISGASQVAIAGSGLASAIKMIPGVGTLLGVMFSPAISGSLTYATGKVFNLHFASGGNLLDLNPEKFRSYFIEQFEAADKNKSTS